MSTENANPSKAIHIPAYNREGSPAGSVEIHPSEFGGVINRQLLHDAVLMYLANQRAGTHSTLRRGEVAGSTKKLFRQKGTGNARVGTRRTNKRRGGGTAKGPKPRDYEYHMPKKAVRAATRMAILSKLVDQEALIIEDLKLPEVDGPSGSRIIKTKEIAKLLKALKIGGSSCLIGTASLPPLEDNASSSAVAERESHQKLHRAVRNVHGLKMMPAGDFNAYTVLRQKKLLLTRAAFDELRKAASSSKE